jgi:adenylosuccinate synthase
MPTIAVVGAQWGDEGKGKIIDYISGEAHIIARYQGGPNAGHTVVIGAEKYVFHHIPSGILHSGKKCVIGNGVVIDLPTLVKEIENLEARGLNMGDRLFISERAHLILPYHKAMDVEAENRKQTGKIGTTGRGIGPAYADKAARIGLRMTDLRDESILREKLKSCLEEKNLLLERVYDLQGFDYQEIYEEYMGLSGKICGYVTDTGGMLRQAIARGQKVLLEGAQGTLLDVDQGTYPYVTSSNATVGGACTGLGIPPQSIDLVLGVTKAYTTRVGMGPFPTELHDSMGDLLRDRGNEYGSTTGRPRRCGWFDAVVVRHALELNGIEGLAVIKLDVLDRCETIQVCTSYRLDGATLTHLPVDAHVVARCEPVYESLPGWMSDTLGVKKWDDLPREARGYLDRLKDILQTEVMFVSTGAERDETINAGFAWPEP